MTTDVGPLSGEDVARALAAGTDFARETCARGLIAGALLAMGKEFRHVGVAGQIDISERERLDA